MTTYNLAIALDDDVIPNDYLVYVTLGADAVPGGAISLGSITHDEAHGTTDNLPGSPEGDNHVLFHHVRDRLYKIDPEDFGVGFWPENITDLQRVRIIKHGPRMNVDHITLVTAGTTTPTVGQTRQLTTTAFSDEQVSLGVVTPAASGTSYVSSDVTKATVNAAGLVTAVAVGAVSITATYQGKTAKVDYTVS